MDSELEQSRKKIAEVDEIIMQLIAKRMQLVKEVGKQKVERKLPIKDFDVEKSVISRYLKSAKSYDLPHSLGEEIAKILIHHAVWLQDSLHASQKHQTTIGKKKILIIGGGGKMGKWLAEFFHTFGHAISLYDKNLTDDSSSFPVCQNLEEAHKFDLIILSTPISATAFIIEELIKIKVKGLIFDICSLKSPIIPIIEKAQSCAIRIASIHPMFGPHERILTGKNIIICQTGISSSDQEVTELFADSTATITQIPLHQHDHYMGYVLGLSHFLNLVFAQTLVQSNLDFQILNQVASTTFQKQVEITKTVTSENKQLYFEIQSLNEFTEKITSAYINELHSLRKAIIKDDYEHFYQLMEASRSYFNQEK